MPATKKLKALAAQGFIAVEVDPVISSGLDDLPHKVRADGKRQVEKNSLNESELIAAKLHAKELAKLGAEGKRIEKRAANRLSAFQSRERRKVIIQQLQERIAEITKDTTEQKLETEKIKIELDAVKKERDMLRQQLREVGKSGTYDNLSGCSAAVCNAEVTDSANAPKPEKSGLVQCFAAMHQSQAQPPALAPRGIAEDARALMSGLMGIQRQQAFHKSPTQHVAARSDMGNIDFSALGNATSTLQQLLLLQQLRNAR